MQTWEALYRAQSLVARELLRANTWDELSAREYGVLYELTRWPDGARLSDLRADELLTQPGLSRLVARLERCGLIARSMDDKDHRASRLRLTKAGRSVQHRVGAKHARHITDVMRLCDTQLHQLYDACNDLIAQLNEPDKPVENNKAVQ